MAKKIQISDTELRRLYLDEYLTPAAIAEKMGCSSEGIRAMLRRAKIPLRNISQARRALFGIEIPCDQLQRLYEDGNLSADQIARQVQCSGASVRRRLRECGIQVRADWDTPLKYPRRDFDGDEYFKAYLIGFRQGDLRATFGKQGGKSRTVRVEMSSTIEVQLKLFHELFGGYGYVWEGKVRSSGRQDLACNLNLTFDFLLSKQDRVEKWIFENDGFMAAFVAGYVDAEGTFSFNKGDPQFSIDSCDRGILRAIYKWLERNKMKCPAPHIIRKKGSFNSGVDAFYSDDLWRLAVYRKQSLANLIVAIKPHMRHAKRKHDMMLVWKHLKQNRFEGEKNV